MKKIIIVFIILSIIIGGFVLLSRFFNRQPNSSNYNTTKILAENTSKNENINISTNKNNNGTESNTNNVTETENKNKQVSIPKETEIATFTTKKYSKYSERQTNISLTCEDLNDTIVKSGDTFSFNETVGKATKSKGYEKANVFKDGKEVRELGGGKCQVSSTLYNAVLQIPELEVLERHPHSGKVYYVPEGKDAAVSYGTYDFSFKNNTNYDIKIKAENTKDNIKISLLKIE